MAITITKVENSRGIIFDSALLELASFNGGDKLNVTVREGGAIMLLPHIEAIELEVAASIAADEFSANLELCERLSQ
ncbi:MAG: hypothetical protein ABGY95_05490 [Rubritalea sp.]|uniref:AbrB/MazE/SpoVT family DNA-binding domain-containing protein n=1 Tax=Rubritalea sp. TaxID=2109375 RepID=UPI003242AFEC